METLRPILEQQAFLQGLEPPYLDLLVGCASNVRFEPGEYFFHEGKDANHFYVLRSGRVTIETYSPGRGSIIIQTLGEGEVLGWSWLIPPYKWQFDARALVLTRAIALDTTCLRSKCEDDHDLGYEIMKRFANVIVQRLKATHLQLVDISEGGG
ncbi:MAG TPA: cyclic nucleotide-binding domain-containing protein [Armatimonadota bacterium]|jgi:CRP-like cAMP-binding protein